MPGTLQTRAFHTDVDEHGRPLTVSDRERLLKPYLPATPQNRSPNLTRTSSPANTKSQRRSAKRQRRLRPFIKNALHLLLFTIMSFVFSIWIRVRATKNQLWNKILSLLYYHHRSPDMIRKDVSGLKKVPNHLSIILSLPAEAAGEAASTSQMVRRRRRGSNEGLDQMLNDACEIVAWTASAGIPTLSIYERSGVLKASHQLVQRRIARTLTDYYGTSNPLKPTFSLHAPNVVSASSSPASPIHQTNGVNGDVPTQHEPQPPHLNVILLDAADGRQTLVDLTRTLAAMSQAHKISPADISQELIDAEISESTGMGEPDLLITFGERVVLEGYPPWQVRLTEIWNVTDYDGGASYGVFLRGLVSFAGAEMRFGR
ncbi:Undecaprenyl diphosphate synthase [Polychaeton citri CBS 116435]|uniref:ditrans,polycis-polyprenyl diphosphate synthase [(2E,6E)-farnesyldiphosphate specific] n=1 Tax=Polychaeton citri CBS 116435 TaxID=1314669 RepID=A0A9P4Q5M5_9PEZI|nr:Undecaprenyl diphosphate synthase [Polychaeton citri CBS 116435]